MAAGRTTVVEIRTDLLEALRELHPGRSDREILESIVREYLARRGNRDAPVGRRPFPQDTTVVPASART